MTDITLKIGEVAFKNPVFSASGIWGYGIEVSGLVDMSRMGAVVTKTITLDPRPGNPQPRIMELGTGMLNSIGLENVGLEDFINDKLPSIKKAGIAVIVSVAGDDLDELKTIGDRLSQEGGFCGIEVNLGCPNVEKGGLDHGRDPGLVRMITKEMKARFPDRMVSVKLTPNLTSISEAAAAAEEGGVDAVVAINTVLGADFSLESGKPVFPRVRAGYSGPGILPIALEKVWEVSEAVNVPVIGVGGISSVEDARKFFLAGASAVQVGTALFTDPGLAVRIVDALEKNPDWIGNSL